MVRKRFVGNAFVGLVFMSVTGERGSVAVALTGDWERGEGSEGAWMGINPWELDCDARGV